MRFLMVGLVSIFVGGACGKKVEPPVAVDAAALADTAPAPEPDSAAAPAPDVAPAAPDTAAAAPDTAAPATPDAAPATPDAAPTTPDAAAAANPDAATAATDTAVAAAVLLPEPTAPPKPFHDMSEDEQKKHMKQVVIPVMRVRFQDYDSEKFAKVNCVTCHGEGALKGKFELPNPELTKLPKTQEGFMKLLEKEPKAMEFMGKVVVPAMAMMIGEPPFDPATQKGFGCMECHTTE